MQAIGKWLLSFLFGWLADYIRELVNEYVSRKRIEREREEANAKAEQKLEEAKSEQEIIDAGSEHLKR